MIKKKIKYCTVGELDNICGTYRCDECPLFNTGICKDLSIIENRCSHTDIIGKIIERCDECPCNKCDECGIHDDVCGCIEDIRECLDIEISIPDKEEISDDEEFIVAKEADTFLFDECNKSDWADACEPSKEWYIEQCKKLEHENHRLRKLVRILLDEIPEE